MSDAQEVLDDLEELTPENSPYESANTEKFLIFSVLDKLYSFQSRYIGEIASFDSVFPLPLMPGFVLGVINRYSVPYALFDISLLFHNTPTPHNKVLIVKDEIDRIAFLINDIAGIADIPHDKMIVKDRAGESDDLAEAVSASFTWNENDVLVLDIQKILTRVTGGTV